MCNLTQCGAQSSLPKIEVTDAERRRFIAGLASLPLATVLAVPQLARAAAERTDEIFITLNDGSPVRAAVAYPAAEQAPAIILIHEWWGLNEQTKSVAAQLAEDGYIALAVDLFRQPATDDPAQAREMVGGVDPQIAIASLNEWADWLRANPRCNGKVANMGWCFGGGWALRAAVATPLDATVIYYGDVTVPSDELRAIKGPILGHFATEDDRIDELMVAGFRNAMADAGLAGQLKVHWYLAEHAFANPSGARYDEHNAALSWARTRAFLRENLM